MNAVYALLLCSAALLLSLSTVLLLLLLGAKAPEPPEQQHVFPQNAYLDWGPERAFGVRHSTISEKR